ncbi:hypothetical protein G7046_g1861 [Stylonectria norvegica]|nr:hypothetical protein G7046_g1861 [Stylonectria norvegica]
MFDGIRNARGRKMRLLITIVCGCSFSLFGYDQALYGGVASGSAFLKQFKNPSPTMTGQTAALYDIGCLLGALAAAVVASSLGHKKTLLLGSTILVIGAIIQTASVNLGMLIAGRIIGGIGNGMNTSISPVYHAETSRAASRGRAIIGELFILDVGWLIAQFVTLGFSFVKSGLQWRFPTAFQIVYLIPVFLLLPLLPDSPRWLSSRGRFDEAEAVLAQIMDQDPSSPEFQEQFKEIREVVRLEHAAEEVKFSDLWTGEGRNLYRLLVACSCQLMAQMGGINIIAYYIVIIFESQLGLSSTLSRILAACAGFGWLFSNVASMFVIESWGRRKLLMIGGVGQGLCFLISGIAIATGDGSKWAGIVVVVMIYMFFIVFAFAWQSIPFFYPAEVASLKYRAKFYPLANGCNWAINYVVVLVTPIGLANIGWRFYIIFAAFNMINVFLVWFFFVETSNKTLEDIDMMFIGEQVMEKKDMPPFLRLRKGTLKTSREFGTSEGMALEDSAPEKANPHSGNSQVQELENGSFNSARRS